MVKNEKRKTGEPRKPGAGESGREAIPGCMKVARIQHPESLRLHVTRTHATVPESTIMVFQRAGVAHEAKPGFF